MGIADVRVDRGDGRLFSFTDQEAKRFLAANPGAKVVKGRVSDPNAPTAAEEAATAALQADGGLESKTKAELVALAEERGIEGVKESMNKADILAVIEAHQGE